MKSNEQSLKDALFHWIESKGFKSRIMEQKVKQIWKEKMMKSISKQTKTMYVKDRKLYMEISSYSLKQELIYSKTKIIQMLNENLGEEYIMDVHIY